MIDIQRRSATALAMILSPLVLSPLMLWGCNQNQGQTQQTAAASDVAPASGGLSPLPLTTAAPPPAASVAAPAAQALPGAPAASVSYLDDPQQQYAYADRAADLSDAIGDAPPDYAFDYDGAQPWAWQGDDYTRVAEPTPDGERYYYYQSGADEPYLVQDGDYSYAYSGSDLVVVYGPGGRVMPPAFVQGRVDVAGRYLARARALHKAAFGGQRQAVAVQSWQARRPMIDQQRAQWQAARNQSPQWQAYHQANQPQDAGFFQAERDRRSAEAQAYNNALGGPPRPGASASGAEVAGAALVAAAAAYTVSRNHGQERGGPGPGPNGGRPAPAPLPQGAPAGPGGGAGAQMRGPSFAERGPGPATQPLAQPRSEAPQSGGRHDRREGPGGGAGAGPGGQRPGAAERGPARPGQAERAPTQAARPPAAAAPERLAPKAGAPAGARHAQPERGPGPAPGRAMGENRPAQPAARPAERPRPPEAARPSAPKPPPGRPEGGRPGKKDEHPPG